MVETKPYYFVQSDEGKFFFETAEKFLEHLRGNDPCEAGCEMLTKEQWEKISKASYPDEIVDYNGEP